MPIPPLRADALAARLDLDVSTTGICHACLMIVSHAIDRGNPREIAGRTQSMTPDLWAEGLAEPALASVRRACAVGVPDAEAALADLEVLGARSGVARAIVRRLAADLTRRARTEMKLEELARPRLSQAPPELN